MKYNLSEIMASAHALRNECNAARRKTRENLIRRGYSEKQIAKMKLPALMSMSEALKLQWSAAKARVKSTPEELLFNLRMKDHWTNEDYEFAHQLEERIRSAA